MSIKRRSFSLAVLFAVVILLACQFYGFSAIAQENSGNKTVVIAGSDFQAETANDSAKNLRLLFNSLKVNGGISAADGFLFCGDYSRTTNILEDNTRGVEALVNTAADIVPRESIVLVQGNHDCGIGTVGMSPSGNNDPQNNKYGVYVINEDDYMWYEPDEQRVIETAVSLKKYLDEKIEEKYQAPIFVVSHLPLHVSMRTQEAGDATKYAKYLFDVLNNAGEQGLNIFFLFGHNHGDGWDDYLGGASVYLAKGDDILIKREYMSTLVPEKLSFYYMNAGYVGYYAECNEGADHALTLTSFVFDDQTMEICRYDVDDVHNLKSKGVINSYRHEDFYNFYSADTRECASPKIIKLNSFDLISDLDFESIAESDDIVSKELESTPDLSRENEKVDWYITGSSVVLLVIIVFSGVMIIFVTKKKKQAKM